LKHAAWFFLEGSARSQEPFIVHNVDVVSTIDLARMMRFHVEHAALATLAVQDRATSRYLLFDQHGQLCGRRAGQTVEEAQPELVRPAAAVQALAFSGIHILSPRIFATIEEEGAFSIIPAYLHLAAKEEKILAFRADEYYWRDLGRPQSILQAALDIDSGTCTGA
jgi:NDP-sugar pyrophosphorylase family protein